MARKGRKPNRGSFGKGDPRAGRSKGVLNKVTVMGREFALGVLNSPEYRDWVALRVKEHTLPPPIESLLWQYAVGKPKETVEVTGANGAPVSVIEWIVSHGKATD